MIGYRFFERGDHQKGIACLTSSTLTLTARTLPY